MKKEKKQSKRKQSKIMSFILSHRKTVTILCIVMYVLFTILLCRFTPIENNEKRFSLDRIGASAEIISFFFIVVSSIIAVWQYYISCRNEHIKNGTEKIQRSIDLIGYYKDNILDKISAIIIIFEHAGIRNIMDHLDKSAIEHFDAYELNKLLTKEDITSLKNIETSDEFIKAILIANEAFNLSLPCVCDSDNFIETKDEDIKKFKTKIYNAFMSTFISDTLNNLEYFSMHFSHNIADESVIYQSTHQTYILIVELLYYHIAQKNTTSAPKYYTNLIHLYNIWKKKQLNQKEEIIKELRSAVEQGSYAENIEI